MSLSPFLYFGSTYHRLFQSLEILVQLLGLLLGMAPGYSLTLEVAANVTILLGQALEFLAEGLQRNFGTY